MRRATRTWLVLLGAVLLATTVRASAAASTSVRLALEIVSERRLVRGDAAWTVSNAGGVPVEHLSFSLYANRFAEPPAWLSGLTWFRVFPGGFDPGRTRIAGAVVDGREQTLPPDADGGVLLTLPLARALAPGASVEVLLRFETRVPERFGPFGAAHGLITLEGGYYPAPLAFGPEGQRDDVPPAPHRAEVTLRADIDGHAFIGGRQRRCRAGEPVRPVVLPRAEAVSLQLRPATGRLAADIDDQHRVDLVFTPPRRDVPRPDVVARPREPLSGAPAWRRFDDLGWLDLPGETMATAEDALRFLLERAPGLAPRRLRLIEAPLRRQLAIPCDGGVWISSRLLRLSPVERLRKFHRVALVRALFAHAARLWLREREPTGDRDWVADVVAEHLTRAFVVARYEGEEDAFDVLAPGAFLSAIDDVLYAPQMPFQTAYFNVVDDTDPQRESYRLFFGARPTGRRLYEKLRDLLGAEALAKLLDAYLADPERRPLRGAAGAPPETFFVRWLGPYPPGNLRLVGIASRPVRREEGPGGRFLHTAVVTREGPRAPEEPVTVRFYLADGRHVDVRWDGKDTVDRVELRDDAALEHVHLDPRGRLVQWLPGVADDLRLDDRTALDMKVLLERLYFTVTPTSGTFSAEAELVFQRRYDIRHKVGVFPFAFPGKIGSSLYYAYGFGPRVRANRLGAFVMGVVRGAAVRSDGDWHPGFVLQVSAGYTDVVTPYEMMSQNVAVGVLRYLTSPNAGATRHGGQVDLVGSIVRSPHARHRLGLRLALGTTFGDVAEGERLSLGGPGGVRAIGPTEWRGRHRLALGLEYRHVWTRSVSVSLAQLAWLEGVEGVLFLDAGVSADRWPEVIAPDAAVLGVGYGLRFHLAVLGVQPSMLALDVAYPLPTSVRLRARTGSPVGLHVYFSQNF